MNPPVLSVTLDSAIEREKGVQVIGVHRKSEKLVVTLLVMRTFSGFLGASRTCAYFRDSTVEFRVTLTAPAFHHYIALIHCQTLAWPYSLGWR